MIRSHQGKTPQIAAGCYVDESAQVIGEVTLGEHSSVWMNCVVRGDVNYIRIGTHTNIQDNSVLHGLLGRWPVEVGNWVTVGHSVTLHGCVVEDRCLIGMGAIVLNGARVGEGSIIAAGAVIPEGTIIEPYSLWAGVPGRFLKKTDNEAAQKSILQYAKNYLGYKEHYLREFK
jgi:carbonic anhydrase/acetyltransferase-like protein (isoleucine patch superfamily)